jgi:hypothetical protein
MNTFRCVPLIPSRLGSNGGTAEHDALRAQERPHRNVGLGEDYHDVNSSGSEMEEHFEPRSHKSSKQVEGSTEIASVLTVSCRWSRHSVRCK